MNSSGRCALATVLLALLAGCASNGAPPQALVALEREDDVHFIASFDAIPLAETDTGAWPKAWQLSVDVTLANPKSSKYRKPYVAVWIENAAGEPVRFITVWGKQLKYQRDLRDFWRHFKLHDKAIDAVTAPTRSPGEHKLAMDGVDSAGKPLPAGEYTVHVEVVREHGTRVHMKKNIQCKADEVTAKLEANLEVAGVTIRYGPKK